MNAARRSLKLLITTLGLSTAMTVAAEPVGTAFTYQGRLKDDGVLADGNFDIRIILFDGVIGGSQVGPILTFEDHPVDDGFFTLQLDFGDVFDGRAFWLEVAIRTGGSGGFYDILKPRQPLTPSPNSRFAVSAGDGVPSGAVILWLGDSCPAGYTRTSALDGRFLVSGPTYNPDAGGSNTKDLSHTHGAGSYEVGSHTHGGSHTHSFVAVVSNAGGINPATSTTAPSPPGDTSQGASLSGTSGIGGDVAFDPRPAFSTILLCQKD